MGGGTPEGWRDNLAKLRQKDLDARWLKKNGKDTYGFKMHTLLDAGCKLIRSVVVTPASVRDSQVLGTLVEGAGENESPLVYCNSAYSSAEIEGLLSRKDLVSMINRKGCRHKKLSEADKRLNGSNARVRVRVEHVHASLVNEIGGKQVRSVGLRRARVDLFLKALAYNTQHAARLLTQEWPEAAAA